MQLDIYPITISTLVQTCIDEANPGDTCLIRSGRYHEGIMISDKNNLAIRGDTDFELPVIDGTVDLTPMDGNWKEEFIGDSKVCISEIDVKSSKKSILLRFKRGVA